MLAYMGRGRVGSVRVLWEGIAGDRGDRRRRRTSLISHAVAKNLTKNLTKNLAKKSVGGREALHIQHLTYEDEEHEPSISIHTTYMIQK